MKEASENVCFYFMIGFHLDFVFRYSILNIYVIWWEINSKKYLLELIKRRSTVQEKNMLCERRLNFDQWKKYKPKDRKLSANESLIVACLQI